MKWLPVDAYHWRRECGRYTVDRAVIPGSRTGERFCAWFKQHADAPPELLDCHDDLGAAIRRCAIHLRTHVHTESDSETAPAIEQLPLAM